MSNCLSIIICNFRMGEITALFSKIVFTSEMFIDINEYLQCTLQLISVSLSLILPTANACIYVYTLLYK